MWVRFLHARPIIMTNKKFQDYLHSLVFTGGSVIKVGNSLINQKYDGKTLTLEVLESKNKDGLQSTRSRIKPS